jgi:hypothetical protein
MDILKITPTGRNMETCKQCYIFKRNEGLVLNGPYTHKNSTLFEFALSINRGGVQDVTNRTSGSG